MCWRAMAGFVSNWISSGTPACFLRAWSSAHSCGKYKRQATGRLARLVLTDRLTATRQFSCLPTWPQYCRTTPTECLPFFGFGGGHQHGSVHYQRRDFEAIGIGRMENPLRSQGRNILGSDLLQACIAAARVVSVVGRPASLG